MGIDESFLARWSRRKGAAARAARQRPAGEAAPATASQPQAAETTVALDPASLPPLESIEAGSDIRAFLLPGVPPDLARAALRRAWSTDPAIRDFIGLSENSWDFTARGGVPGFGEVTPDQVQRLLAQLTGDEESEKSALPAVERATTAAAGLATSVQTADGAASGQVRQIPDDEMNKSAVKAAPQHNPAVADAVAVHEFARRKGSPRAPKRRHGGALPE
jgi:hypothetical protein